MAGWRVQLLGHGVMLSMAISRSLIPSPDSPKPSPYRALTWEERLPDAITPPERTSGFISRSTGARTPSWPVLHAPRILPRIQPPSQAVLTARITSPGVVWGEASRESERSASSCDVVWNPFPIEAGTTHDPYSPGRIGASRTRSYTAWMQL